MEYAEKPVNVATAVSRYLDIRRAKVAANTYRNDLVAMNLLTSAVGARLPIEQLTRELIDVKFFAPGGVAYDMAASSFNAYLSRMRRFTQTCLSYGWIDRDPLIGVTGRRREIRGARQILTPAELLSLVEVARSPRDRIALAVAVNTGLRASEITDIRIGDVQLDRGYLAVRIVKTVDIDRMPITADLDRELRRWFAHLELHLCPVEKDFYLIPQQTYAPHHLGDVAMDYRLHPTRHVAQPYDIVKRSLDAMGFDSVQEGFHTIRRSVGRAYYDMMRKQHGHESALVATAALLHHKDVRQTMHYIGVKPERMERDQILRGQPFLTALAKGDPAVRRLRAVQ